MRLDAWRLPPFSLASEIPRLAPAFSISASTSPRLNVQRNAIHGAHLALGSAAENGFPEGKDLDQIASFNQEHLGG